MHNKREFMAHFAKGLERKAFIKQPKREWSLESPGKKEKQIKMMITGGKSRKNSKNKMKFRREE